MGGEKLRPSKNPNELPSEAEITKILENDHVSTWEDIPASLTEEYGAEIQHRAIDSAAAAQREEKLGQLADLVKELSPSESFLIRLRTGAVVEHSPMHSEEVVTLFPTDRAKQDRVRKLAGYSTQQAAHTPSDVLFDRAILTVLGKMPYEEKPYTFEEIGNVLGTNKESLRRKYIVIMKQLNQDLLSEEM